MGKLRQLVKRRCITDWHPLPGMLSFRARKRVPRRRCSCCARRCCARQCLVSSLWVCSGAAECKAEQKDGNERVPETPAPRHHSGGVEHSLGCRGDRDNRPVFGDIGDRQSDTRDPDDRPWHTRKRAAGRRQSDRQLGLDQQRRPSQFGTYTGFSLLGSGLVLSTGQVVQVAPDLQQRHARPGDHALHRYGSGWNNGVPCLRISFTSRISRPRTMSRL